MGPSWVLPYVTLLTGHRVYLHKLLATFSKLSMVKLEQSFTVQ